MQLEHDPAQQVMISIKNSDSEIHQDSDFWSDLISFEYPMIVSLAISLSPIVAQSRFQRFNVHAEINLILILILTVSVVSCSTRFTCREKFLGFVILVISWLFGFLTRVWCLSLSRA